MTFRVDGFNDFDKEKPITKTDDPPKKGKKGKKSESVKPNSVMANYESDYNPPKITTGQDLYEAYMNQTDEEKKANIKKAKAEKKERERAETKKWLAEHNKVTISTKRVEIPVTNETVNKGFGIAANVTTLGFGGCSRFEYEKVTPFGQEIDTTYRKEAFKHFEDIQYDTITLNNNNNDTITPGGDPVKPKEVWNQILHDMILPTDEVGLVNEEQTSWPVGNDTIGFTDEIEESVSYQKITMKRKFDLNNTTENATAYTGTLRDNFNNGPEYKFTSKIYNGTYQGQTVKKEVIDYHGKKPRGMTVPDVIYYVPGESGDKTLDAYYCDNSGNILEVKTNFAAKGNDGKYYFRQQWGEVNNGMIQYNGDQYYDVHMIKIPWNDVPFIDDGK